MSRHSGSQTEFSRWASTTGLMEVGRHGWGPGGFEDRMGQGLLWTGRGIREKERMPTGAAGVELGVLFPETGQPGLTVGEGR